MDESIKEQSIEDLHSTLNMICLGVGPLTEEDIRLVNEAKAEIQRRRRIAAQRRNNQQIKR